MYLFGKKSLANLVLVKLFCDIVVYVYISNNYYHYLHSHN